MVGIGCSKYLCLLSPAGDWERCDSQLSKLGHLTLQGLGPVEAIIDSGPIEPVVPLGDSCLTGTPQRSLTGHPVS